MSTSCRQARSFYHQTLSTPLMLDCDQNKSKLNKHLVKVDKQEYTRCFTLPTGTYIVYYERLQYTRGIDIALKAVPERLLRISRHRGQIISYSHYCTK